MRFDGNLTIRGLLGILALTAVTASHARAQATPAPASPSYAAIIRTIDEVRQGWKSAPPSEAAGWNAYFDELRSTLQAHTAARSSDDQLAALNGVYRLASGLDDIAWNPALELRSSLRDWLRPRVRTAWAERRLTEALVGDPVATDEPNRKGWRVFMADTIGPALLSYEGAKTVQERQRSLTRIHEALAALRHSNGWAYSAELQAGLDGLFNNPNLDISADVASLYPVLANPVVTTGPIYRDGYWSEVTAGPYAGFGLLYSDEGIAFTNSQYLTSVTPITDFQRQLEQDRKGRRAAKVYDFSATSVNNGIMTITAILNPYSGLQLLPSPGNNVDAQIGSTPIPGKGLARAIYSLVGFGQARITQKVYEGAIDRIRQNVAQGGLREANERAGEAQSLQNARLGEVLRGDGSATVRDIQVAGLSLRSRPENALIGGTVRWASGSDQGGADLPQPPRFATPDAGISADIHLASVANNVARGYLTSPAVADVQNLLIETRKVPPGTKPGDAAKVTKNVDFPTYIKAVDAARAPGNPEGQAIRIRKPKQAPEFGVDARGYLVVIAHDLVMDLPVPAQIANNPLAGAAAKVYRLEAATAEFVFEIRPVTQPDGSIRLTGNLKDFVPAPGSRVLAINDDEAKAVAVDPFRSVFIFQGFAAAIRSRPLDVPLENLKLRGYNIRSVSDLDPTGWMRVVLTPTGERPITQTAQGR